MSRAIKVIIADDHPIFRHGLQHLIGQDHDIQIISDAADGKTALNRIRELKPAIAVLDVDMPQMDGLEVTRQLKKENLDTKVIVLTGYKDQEVFNTAMDAGVFGYVLKESAVEDIVEAVQAVASGNYFISPAISAFLVNRRNTIDKFRKENPALDYLTKSEIRILRLIADNKTSKEIASDLGISPRTVENHRANICNKLNLHGIHSLVKFAFDNKAKLGSN
ncbi:MAG: response regulator [Verrucomicrobiales bacterium]